MVLSSSAEVSDAVAPDASVLLSTSISFYWIALGVFSKERASLKRHEHIRAGARECVSACFAHETALTAGLSVLTLAQLITIASQISCLIPGSVLASFVTKLTESEDRPGGPYGYKKSGPLIGIDPMLMPGSKLLTNCILWQSLRYLDITLPALDSYLLHVSREAAGHGVTPALFGASLAASLMQHPPPGLSAFKATITQFRDAWAKSYGAYWFISDAQYQEQMAALVDQRVQARIADYVVGSSTMLVQQLKRWSIGGIVSHQKNRTTPQLYTPAAHAQEANRQAVFAESRALFTEQLGLHEREVDALFAKIQPAEDALAISCTAYQFYTSLLPPLRQQKIASQLVSFGVGTVLGWLAYTLIDAIYDTGGEAIGDLAIACSSLRWSAGRFMQVAAVFDSQQGQSIVSSIFDRIDAANRWEYLHARIGDSAAPIIIPSYGDGAVLAERSFGHAIGPLLIMERVAPEMVGALRTYFHHFLIARQLLDDMHDWEDDLSHGRMTVIVAQLLTQHDLANKPWQQLCTPSFQPNLRNIFWHSVVGSGIQLVENHLSIAKDSLTQLSACLDITTLYEALHSQERICTQTRHTCEQMTAFVDHYSQVV